MTVPQASRHQVARVPVSCDPDTWALHVRLARRHDPDDVRALAETYDGYACALAHQMGRGVEPPEDLEQVAREALIRALYRFDPDRCVPFQAFARPTIVGTLRRHYRDRGWLVHVPRSVHDLTVAVRITADRMRAQLGRYPSNTELASELGVSVGDVYTVDEGVIARNPTSLDAVPDTGGIPLTERVGAADPQLDLVEDFAAVSAALGELTATDRLLVQLYFLEELTQLEVGRRLGVSQMQVSRRLTQVLGQLRRRTEWS